MLTTRLLICLGVLGPAAPALAAQFYIVQDSATNRCTITEQAPDLSPAVSTRDNPLPASPPYPTASPGTPSPSTSTNAVLVGDGAYGDRAAAEADMRAIAACAANRQ
jgi:hypothetical protein